MIDDKRAKTNLISQNMGARGRGQFPLWAYKDILNIFSSDTSGHNWIWFGRNGH